MNDEATNRKTAGMKKRRQVLGDRHVDRAVAGTNEFNAPFQSLITEAAWGTVWSGDHWDDRQRSIVTLALLAGLGHHEELAMHIRATVNTGASREDIREVFQHVAIYAGVPTANAAIRIAQEVFREMDDQ